MACPQWWRHVTPSTTSCPPSVRAPGYRSSQRAYLIQLRREGAGTALIDPLPFADSVPSDVFAPLNEAVADAEWIIHAASQDLVCLAELGLRPTRLFDTELAGRL